MTAAARAARRPDRRRLTPRGEGLEDRQLLYATLGGQWALPARVTYSFAPDGADIGGVPNALGARMASLGYADSAWKDEFRKAAAAWGAQANVNLVEVPDDGSPFGAPGNQQGDARFGDIRIGGIAQAPTTLAVAFDPPPLNGGSLAGDIVMNPDLAWRIGGNYDLRTVATHEFGHALGLDHSSQTFAAMFANYNGVKTTLNADDVAGIQALYGARQADAYEPNNGLSTVTNLNGLIGGNLQLSLSGLDITTSNDTDWFTVVVPAGTTGAMTVRMQSAGLSSLSPRVVVYTFNNGILNGLGQDSRPNTYGSTASFVVSGVVPGQRYYIRTMAAASGITGAGAYALQVNFGNAPQAPAAPPITTVPAQPDQGGGSTGLSGRGRPRRGAGGDDRVMSLGGLTGTGDCYLTPAAPRPGPPWLAAAGLAMAAEPAPPAAEAAATAPARRAARAAELLDLALDAWDLDA
jgi:hypothetical protein